MDDVGSGSLRGSVHGQYGDTLRHAFATHLVESSTDLATLQTLLGHSCIKTTMRYLHVTTGTIAQRVSPLDQLVLAEPAPRR